MSCSVAIMAHPARRKFVDGLFLALDRHASVIWDQIDDRWDTGRRSLLTRDPTRSHHLIVQDDAMICRDFVAGCEQAIAATDGEVPLSFYIGKVRPHAQTVTPLVTQALRDGKRWFIHEGPWWGVAIAVPTAHIPELVEWCDTRPDIENYDKRISRWYGHMGLKCWYTLPSLADHRPVNENPSLIPGRIGNRRAHRFIGMNRSALEIDWSAEEVVAYDEH